MSIIHFELTLLNFIEFQDVDVMELQPFLAVMRMLKLEYGKSNNALYRLLITILQEYDPNLGEDHREKVTIFNAFRYPVPFIIQCVVHVLIYSDYTILLRRCFHNPLISGL